MYRDVIEFWFEEIEQQQWWVKDSGFDALIRQRFGELHQQAIHGELYGWRDTALGRLAEIIVLDQFSRNLYRDSAQAFSNDIAALILAQEAVALKLDQQLSKVQRSFMYMPYMHSESLAIHDAGLPLFERLGMASTLDFERQHYAIIERFGRYPHRNAILGRTSTAQEVAFLQTQGSSF